MKPVKEVPGLYYAAKAVSRKYLEDIEKCLKSETHNWKNVGTGKNTRRALHLGYDYNYKSGKVKKTAPIPAPFARLARFAEKVIKKTLGVETVPEFDQCLVNEYIGDKGHGISWHIDHKNFGPYIVSFTFESGTVMEFRRKEDPRNVISIRVDPRSMYLMSGEARYKWQHSMPQRKSDPNPEGGKRIKRGDRYSITFRSVPK